MKVKVTHTWIMHDITYISCNTTGVPRTFNLKPSPFQVALITRSRRTQACPPWWHPLQAWPPAQGWRPRWPPTPRWRGDRGTFPRPQPPPPTCHRVSKVGKLTMDLKLTLSMNHNDGQYLDMLGFFVSQLFSYNRTIHSMWEYASMILWSAWFQFFHPGRQRSMREYTSMMTVILEIAYDDQEQPVDEELVSKSKTY